MSVRRSLSLGCIALSMFVARTAHADLQVGADIGWAYAGDASHVADTRLVRGTSAFVVRSDPLHDAATATFGSGPFAQLHVRQSLLSDWLSIGIVGGVRMARNDDAPTVGWNVGPKLRFAATFSGAWVPWGSFGVEYAGERRSVRYKDADAEVTHRGVALPVAIGLGYRVDSHFAIGPSLRVARVISLSACYDGPMPSIDPSASPSTKSCTGDADALVEARSYTVWSIGLEVSAGF